MAKDIIELLGLKPTHTIKDNKEWTPHYDVSKTFEICSVYVSIATDRSWHQICIENRWTRELLVKVICYNTKLFIKQIKLLEKELDIKLIKEDGCN